MGRSLVHFPSAVSCLVIQQQDHNRDEMPQITVCVTMAKMPLPKRIPATVNENFSHLLM